MRAMPQSILDGYQTVMLGYDGIVPGPTIEVNRYRKSVVRFINYLPAKHPTFGYQPDTSVHLHGSASLPQFDGYANDITRPNMYKDYQYPNIQEARTLWYHDHAAHKTAKNAYSGLAAFYLIHDDLEKSLPLPKKPYDVPLMITDAMFNSDGQLMWIEDERLGMNGDVILVNGQPWPFMEVERRKYRFRMLVASVSRDYRWALDSGDPFTIVATDAGLLEFPQVVDKFRHGNAERYEVVIDFAKYQPGQRVRLLNLGNNNNINYENTGKVMEFRVIEATSPDNSYVPDVMNTEDETMKLQPAQAPNPPRVISLHRDNGTWLINGKRWEDVEASGFTSTLADPMLGAIEIWELRNDSGGWHHPLHIHLVDMKILERSGQAGPVAAAAQARARAEGRLLPRRERAGAGDHQVRAPDRALHDALPQPRPRGPLDDGAVPWCAVDPIRTRSPRPGPRS